MASIDTGDKGGKKDGKVRSKKMSTNVDMAPMCDLGFLLITFFMFTTTFSKPNVMKLNMPPKIDKKDQPKPPEIKISNTFIIVLGKDNRLFWHQQVQGELKPENLNETNYSKDGIRKEILLAKQRALDPKMFTIMIKPTDDSNYKNLVDVLDEMEITNSGKYGIVEVSPWELAVYKQKVGEK